MSIRKIALILVFAMGLFGLAGCTSGATAPEPSAVPSAEPSPESAPEATGEAGRELPVRSIYTGVIDRINQGAVWIKESGSETVTIVVNVTDETFVLDGRTGASVAIDGLKEGSAVVAVTRPIVATSMPPQSPGLAVFTNLPEEGLPPTFAIVKEVTADTDGTTWLVMDENVNWRISAETPLIPYNAGAPVTFDQLKPGMRLVGWYSITTRSFPAQATPDKILVLPDAAQ